MKRQIVFILSTNYAGSHFLALQLGSHSRCLSLGEFHRYRRSPGKMGRSACHICESDDVCPVFKGVYGAPPHELFGRVFGNLAGIDPQLSTVVDNSKKWDWAERFLGLDDCDLRFLHLIRDPRALVRRWLMNSEERGEAWKIRLRTARRLWPHALGILFGPEDNVYVHKWAMQNRQISDFLTRHELASRLLTYRELVHFPDRVLDEIMGWLGHEYEPAQQHYWDFTHHGSQKAQYMKAPEGGKLHDQRWQTDLSTEVQERVTGHAAVRRYIDGLGLQLAANGLVLHPGWGPVSRMGREYTRMP